MTRVLKEGLFALLSLTAVGVAVLLVLVLSGRLVSEPGREPAPLVSPTREAPADEGAKPEPPREKTSAVPVSVARAAPARTRISITASRGDCWLEVRRGSATGAVLFSGVLSEGQSQTFAGRTLWLRLGAAGNVDLTVDGKAHTVPTGTSELTLPA